MWIELEVDVNGDGGGGGSVDGGREKAIKLKSIEFKARRVRERER